MKVILYSLATALLAVSTTVVSASEIVVNGENEVKPEKPVCRAARQTGSRLPTKRVCRTREEWRMEDEAARKDLSRLQRLQDMNNARSTAPTF